MDALADVGQYGEVIDPGPVQVVQHDLAGGLDEYGLLDVATQLPVPVGAPRRE